MIVNFCSRFQFCCATIFNLKMNKIAITTGDPNGIGAEITIKALNKLDLPLENIVLISNKKILDFYGRLNRSYEIIEIPYESDIKPGKITKEAGEFSFQSVKKACEINAGAIVTAPVAKNALYLATICLLRRFHMTLLHLRRVL